MIEHIKIDQDNEYQYVTSPENVSLENNLKAIDYFNKKIFRSQRDGRFCKTGHYFLDFIPKIFVEDIWNDPEELKAGSCKVTITDLFSNKKLTIDMGIDCLVPNKQYIHGTIKGGNKVFGGASILIDSCLHYKKEFDDKEFFEKKMNAAVFKYVSEFPVYDWRLDQHSFNKNYPLNFFDRSDYKKFLADSQKIRDEINNEKKYKYGVFRIKEEWDYPFQGKKIKMVAAKVVMVQAFSPEWLQSQNLPADTPVLADIGGGGHGRKDMRFSYIHGDIQGEKELPSHESNMFITLDLDILNPDDSIFFINTKGRGGGRAYKVNQESKWTVKNPYPLNEVIALPMFSHAFSIRSLLEGES